MPLPVGSGDLSAFGSGPLAFRGITISVLSQKDEGIHYAVACTCEALIDLPCKVRYTPCRLAGYRSISIPTWRSEHSRFSLFDCGFALRMID